MTSLDAFQPRADWTIATLLQTSDEPGAAVDYPSAALPGSELAWRYFEAGDTTPPALLPGGILDFGDGVEDVVASAFWHLSRWEERGGALSDRHGRFMSEAAVADPSEPAVDALAARFRAALSLPQHTRPFTVGLTHDVDSPWRWYGRRAFLGAAARTKRAALGRDRSELLTELHGLARAPVHAARHTDPNWSFEQIADIERRHGGHSTYFVMTGHTVAADGPAPAAYDRRRPAIVTQVEAQGDEVGLHPSYATSDDPELLREELRRLEALTGDPVRGVRFHYLRHRTHTTLPLLEQLGFGYDTSSGYAETPGMRAGFSFPYQPYDLENDRPLELVELPLAIMDATLAEERYLALDPDAGLRRAVHVLERVAAVRGSVSILWHVDRFDPVYGRGWDRVYDRLLEWVVDRGGQLVTAADAAAVSARA